mgnify:CR=1 FL=1
MQAISRQMGPHDSERCDRNLCDVSNSVSEVSRGLRYLQFPSVLKTLQSLRVREGYAKGNAKQIHVISMVFLPRFDKDQDSQTSADLQQSECWATRSKK